MANYVRGNKRTLNDKTYNDRVANCLKKSIMFTKYRIELKSPANYLPQKKKIF